MPIVYASGEARTYDVQAHDVQVEYWLRLAARGGQPTAWLNASEPGVRRTGDAPGTGEGY